MSPKKAQLVISCHADTGFQAHRLRVAENGMFHGHLDNFAGVYAVMKAYFSGRMDQGSVRIELTYGEETDMAGARAVLKSLSADDVVIVVDVTGAETDKLITIEKCRSPKLREFVRKALRDLSYSLHEGCPDPISDSDECDVYLEKLENVCFLGIPCVGGDYNATEVSCRRESVDVAAEALIRLASAFARSWR